MQKLFRTNQTHVNAAQQYVATSSERAYMSDEEIGQLSVYQDGNCSFL